MQKIMHCLECNIYHSVNTIWLLKSIHHPSFPKHTYTNSKHNYSETEFHWIFVLKCGQAVTQLVSIVYNLWAMHVSSTVTVYAPNIKFF
jgi:hypothetical protein